MDTLYDELCKLAEILWVAAVEAFHVDATEFLLAAVFFVLVFFRHNTWTQLAPLISGQSAEVEYRTVRLTKDLEAEFAARRMENVLKLWDQIATEGHVSDEIFQMVVLAYVKCRKNVLLDTVVERIERSFPKDDNAYSSSGPRTDFVNAVLEVLAAPSRRRDSLVFCGIAFFENMFEKLLERVGIVPNGRSYEALFAALVQAKDLDRLAKTFHAVESRSPSMLTAKCYAIAAQGALRCSSLQKAKEFLDKADKRKLSIARSMIFTIVKAACEGDTTAVSLVEEFVFDYLIPKQDADSGQILVTSEVASTVLQYANQKDNLVLLERMHNWSRDNKISLTYGGHDALLKCCTKLVGYEKGKLAFNEMVAAGFRISEGTCSSILIICSETKNVKMAELVFRYFRKTSKTLCLRVCSTMMKVYGNVGSFSKACELYELAKKHNVDPDCTMYGCLMKFAVESGQYEFARELFDLSPSPDIQDYMSLIRACSKERNVPEAFKVLDRLRASRICQGEPMKDIVSMLRPAYNSVLHVVVTCGDMKDARKLIEDMKAMDKDMVNSVTYNTYLKGFCAKHDRKGAQEVLAEMQREGILPDRVTYNSMLNVAVSTQQTEEAWKIVDAMQENGVSVDNYTVTIVLKTMKTPSGPVKNGGLHWRAPHEQQKWNARALKLLDSVDTSEDEFLLKAALDICIRLRHIPRLEALLKQYELGNLRPLVSTYGSLMKAYGMVRKVDRCRDLWKEMTESRGLDPDPITFGCMIDALVTNNDVNGAVSLFENLGTTKFNDPVIFATLLKGFAIDRRSDDALKLLGTMKACGVECNEVAYNTVIDACCRSSNMAKTEELLNEMIGRDLVPDIITFGTIMKGYMTVGRVDSALNTYYAHFKCDRNANSKALMPNEVIFNTLLDGCIKNHRLQNCQQLLDDMVSSGVKPSHITLTIVIKMYGRMQQLDKAIGALSEWSTKYDLKPNNQVFTCLISACIGNHCIDEAVTTLHEMQAKGVSPDERTFGTLLAGLCRDKRVDIARNIVRQAFGLNGGSSAPGVEYQQLARFLELVSPAEAEELLEAIKQTKVGASVAERLIPHFTNTSTVNTDTKQPDSPSNTTVSRSLKDDLSSDCSPPHEWKDDNLSNHTPTQFTIKDDFNAHASQITQHHVGTPKGYNSRNNWKEGHQQAHTTGQGQKMTRFNPKVQQHYFLPHQHPQFSKGEQHQHSDFSKGEQQQHFADTRGNYSSGKNNWKDEQQQQQIMFQPHVEYQESSSRKNNWNDEQQQQQMMFQPHVEYQESSSGKNRKEEQWSQHHTVGHQKSPQQHQRPHPQGQHMEYQKSSSRNWKEEQQRQQQQQQHQQHQERAPEQERKQEHEQLQQQAEYHKWTPPIKCKEEQRQQQWQVERQKSAAARNWTEEARWKEERWAKNSNAGRPNLRFRPTPLGG
eukprot:GEMP01002412.1.p1 GENE.GEMP01002412.1~~GEMP01002412.1.p1  ORF type:complete len:1423 (+),score=398.71 GEMP01002412.1:401-4669(+)